MKKIFIAVGAALLLAAPAAQAQSFLDRLKEKAGTFGGGFSSGSSAGNEANARQAGLGSVLEAAGAAGDEGMSGTALDGAKQVLQPKRSSAFGWNGTVTPSAAKFPIPLMNEFPALPTASQLANPVEAEQIAYYRAVKAVTLRAEELNSDTTCEDVETERWRSVYESSMKDAFGLTDTDLALLDSGSMSEADRARIEEKVRNAFLGGTDMAALEKMGSMSEEEMMAGMNSKLFSVYDRNDANLRKYMGTTAQEQKDLYILTMRDENAGEKASAQMEKKTMAFMKEQSAKNPKFQAEAQAFSQRFQSEVMAAMMQAEAPVLNMMNSMNNVQGKLAPVMERQQKYHNYVNSLAAATPGVYSDSRADARFAAAEAAKLEGIKARIYTVAKTRQECDALFQQAAELIRTYRERAAVAWLADLQKRFDAMKNSMGEIIKINRQAVADGVIPECALWRYPLNQVILAGDLLADAYSEFPCNYPSMYVKELVKVVTVSGTVPATSESLDCPDDGAWSGRKDKYGPESSSEYEIFIPEFFTASSVKDCLSGSNLFMRGGDSYSRFNGSAWGVVTEEVALGAPDAEPAKSGSWTSLDGKRTLVYNAQGGFLQLPEGDIVYPCALEKTADGVVWVEQEIRNGRVGIFKCFYKI